MYDLIFNLIEKADIGNYVNLVTYTITFMIIIMLGFLVKLVFKIILLKMVSRLFRRIKKNWNEILLKNRFYHRLSWLAIPMVFNLFNGTLPAHNIILEKSSSIISIVLFIFVSISFFNCFEEIYRGYEISKTRPIKGMLQVCKVVISIIGGILLISLLIGENPIVLLGGIGAMTAIISLIFKDAILGFVAGIQLTTNDMIRIGDWIEMPKNFADGTVIDLSLTTVKVQNYDKTITTVPTYALISDSFINWRGMAESGARRLKRSILIDASTIKLCDDEMIRKFRKINLITNYIDEKLLEISYHNKEHEIDTSISVNSRHLTNLGVFRVYITEYLKHHPRIQKDMSLMVRQLNSEGAGIPLELYSFTNTTVWAEFEAIQNDIFEHLYSVIPEFDLFVYQQWSGNSIKKEEKQ